MSVSRYRQWMCEQRMKVIISEAARKHNQEALLDVILKKEDGYYSLPYKLVGTEFYDIKTALLYSVQLNKLQNAKTICEFLKRHENMQGLDLDCVIRAIKYRNEKAAELVVSVYQEKLKDKEMMKNEHFICEYSPYHHPRPAVLDLDTVIFAIKNWDAELAQFVISVFLNQSDTHQKSEKLKLILMNLREHKEQPDKIVKCLSPVLNLDNVIFAMKNWDEELAQFIASVYSNNNNLIKCDEKHFNRKLKTFFFQERYDEREPAPIPALKLGLEEVEEQRNTYFK